MDACAWCFTLYVQVKAAFMLREVELENGLPKALMVSFSISYCHHQRNSIKCCRLVSQAATKKTKKNLFKNVRAMSGNAYSVIRHVMHLYRYDSLSMLPAAPAR
jgi:hypothetical protein